MLGVPAADFGAGDPAPRLRVTLDSTQPLIVLDGTAHRVTPAEAALVDALIEADGDWCSGPKLVRTVKELEGVRVDRVKKKLPAPILELIDTKGSGYRITRAQLYGSPSPAPGPQPHPR